MSLVAEKQLERTPTSEEVGSALISRQPGAPAIYAVAVVVGLLSLDVFGGLSYAAAASFLALVAFIVVAIRSRSRTELVHLRVDRLDLVVMAATYAAAVTLYRIAFTVIAGNDIVLFLFFALGMSVGVAGPVIYTVWGRRRRLATLGLTTAELPRVAMFAIVFAAVQFSITFWGYDGLPGSKDIITLGTMALVIGVFESIFFRGFIQGRLQESFGAAPAVFGSAFLYGIYHVGYGMGLEEIVFLTGLGIIYALAYATTESVFVVWPLLTPLGSLFAQLEDGELVGRLPWAALMGWADVAALMITVLWIARKHEGKRTLA